MSGSGRDTGALRAQRVAGLAAGSSARPGLEPAAPRASSLLLSSLSGVHCAPLLWGPLSQPSQPRWAARLGREHGRTPPPAPAHGAGSPRAMWRLRLEKKSDFLSALLWCDLESAGNGSNTRPAPLQSALALLKGSSSHQSLATPSPTKDPRRFVKKGVRSEKYLSSRERDVGDGAQWKMGCFLGRDDQWATSWFAVPKRCKRGHMRNQF